MQVAISADGLAESGMTVVPYVNVHETHTDVVVPAYLIAEAEQTNGLHVRDFRPYR